MARRKRTDILPASRSVTRAPQEPLPPAWTLFRPLPIKPWMGPGSRTAEDSERHRREVEVWERDRQAWEREQERDRQAQRRTQPRRQTGKLGPKGRSTADIVLDLSRQNFKWSTRDVLLTEVRKILGDQTLSIRTLTRVLSELRRKKLIG